MVFCVAMGRWHFLCILLGELAGWQWRAVSGQGRWFRVWLEVTVPYGDDKQ